MRKSLILIICAIILFAATACAKIEAEYMIGNDNKVTVNYRLQADRSKLAGKDEYLNAGLNDTQKYWEEQGMAVTREQDDKTVTLNGKKEIQAQNPKEAFEKLKEILTGEFSPFKTLDFQYAESYLNNKYALSGSVSLEDIIRKGEGKSIPDDMVLQLKDAAASSVYSITITLPGIIKSVNSEKESQKDSLSSSTWHVQYGETKELKIHTQYEKTFNKQNYDALNNEKNTYELVVFLCIGAGALILVAILVILIIMIRKRALRRTSIQA